MGRAFNLIHQPSGQKFDIFRAVQPFHASELARLSGQRLTLPVATAEAIILAKLQWYAAGGEVSERQWADITGVLATSPKLGIGYLRRWANELGVERLLDKALVETRRADASDCS